MSDPRDKPENSEELEALLRQLVPAPLDADLISELNRNCERVRTIQLVSPNHLQWRRLIPLTAVGSLLMCVFGYLQFGDRLSTPSELPDSLTNANESVPTTVEKFLPVSSHGILMNASSGGIVETEDGPREQLNLEYRDAYHWHDPESGTNLRLFQPRSEEIIVPLHSD